MQCHIVKNTLIHITFSGWVLFVHLFHITVGDSNIFGETLVTQAGGRTDIGATSTAGGGVEHRIYITQNPMMIADSSEGSTWSSDEDVEQHQRNLTSTLGN